MVGLPEKETPTMRKVSAQQRIAFLERRIARLERDASFTSDVTGLLKRVYNLPKNFVMNLVNALREAFEMLVRPLFKRMKIMDDHLGVLLAIRIARAFSGLITTADDLPQIVSFDAKKPMESIFTGGIAGNSKVSLKKLANMYDGEQQKRIKAAYLSWHRDFSHILNPPTSQRKLTEIALDGLKRYSKLAYRLISVALPIIGGYQLVATGLVFQLLGVMGAYFFKVGGYSVVKTEVVPTTVKLEVLPRTIEVPNPDYKHFIKDQPIQFDPPKTLPMEIPGETQTYNYNQVINHQANFDVMARPYAEILKANAGIMVLLLSVLEKVMYRWVVKTDEFDEMAKTASKYPAVIHLTRMLESATYA